MREPLKPRTVTLVPTTLQLDVLQAMTQPNTTIRWHANRAPDHRVNGRGQLIGGDVPPDFRLLAGYTVRQLIATGAIAPTTKVNARPFHQGGPAFRDYTITSRGRAVLAHYRGITP